MKISLNNKSNEIIERFDELKREVDKTENNIDFTYKEVQRIQKVQEHIESVQNGLFLNKTQIDIEIKEIRGQITKCINDIEKIGINTEKLIASVISLDQRAYIMQQAFDRFATITVVNLASNLKDVFYCKEVIDNFIELPWYKRTKKNLSQVSIKAMAKAELNYNNLINQAKEQMDVQKLKEETENEILRNRMGEKKGTGKGNEEKAEKGSNIKFN